MSLSVIENTVGNGGVQKNEVFYHCHRAKSTSWIDRILQTMESPEVEQDFHYAATVHPCIIHGRRVLVYEKGLGKREPDAYSYLKSFARENDFELKEDARQSINPVKFERRAAKTMPMLFLASGIFLQGAAQAGTFSINSNPAVQMMPEVQVVGKTDTSDRAYTVRNGKRFVTNPYGDVEAILKVASQTKKQGKLKRVSTRGITMPQDYIGGVINRYDYQFPQQCGGEKFSYYEGEGFGALGYHNGETVVLDVMVGGGPFASPQLWGPYDQVLGDKHNVAMKLMMGNGKQDGMGLLKASYAIGMTPVMSGQDYKRLGDSYVSAVQNTASCQVDIEGPEQPVIRQANNEW
ncbi:MAG: DUF3579 domain-containing protein [Gammaproteobacteria bacterium]